MEITKDLKNSMEKAIAEGTCKQFVESNWKKWDDLVKNINNLKTA